MTLKKCREIVVAAVTFDSERDNIPKPFGGPLERLFGDSHLVRPSKCGPAFSMVLYKSGSTRAIENVCAVTGVALDFDGVTNVQMTELARRLNGLASVVYSTYRHRLTGSEDNRFRVVLPMSRRMSVSEYPEIWSAVNDRLGGMADAKSKDPAHLFYLPSCPPERKVTAFIRYRDGEILNPDQLECPTVLLPVLGEPRVPMIAGGGRRVFEGERNDYLTQVAGGLRRKGCPRESIRDALAAINRTQCEPPLPQAEIETIASSVSRYSPAKPTLTGSPLEIVDLRDLLLRPTPPQDWIVQDLLPRGGLSMIVAKPKCGKSTLMRQLALNVARGEDFLGRETAQGCVFYVALEERWEDVKGHFKTMGAMEEDIKIIPGPFPPDGFTQLRKEIEEKRPILIVIDTLGRVARIKDFNAYGEVTERLGPFLTLAHETSCHVCLVHHAKKTEAEAIDAALGSTALTGTVDTIIHLKRHEGYRTLSTVQRVGDDLVESVLDFNAESRTSTLKGSREDVEIGRFKVEIIDYLTAKDPQEESEIVDAIEGNHSRVRKALRQLVDEGRVKRNGKGKKGDPYLYEVERFPLSRPGTYAETQGENVKFTSTHQNNLIISRPNISEISEASGAKTEVVQRVRNAFPGAQVSISGVTDDE